MRAIFPTFAAALVLAVAAGGFAMAQDSQPANNPTPAQSGADPSMAKPGGSTEPALNQTPPHNPESTVGLAPADQPVNNMKPNVAGEVVPSSHNTAAHEPSIFEHDQQPTITHTFNFTDEQKQALVSALAQEKDMAPAKGLELAETVVVPDTVELKPMPERIASEMPWVKPYFYLKTGGKIAIVDPNLRYIAAIIESSTAAR